MMKFDSVEEFKEAYGFVPADVEGKTDEELEALNEVTTYRTLAIHFIRTDNSNYTMNIPDYLPSISDQDISDGAKAILSGNIFSPGGLDFIRCDSFDKIDRTVTHGQII